jgi:3-phosphoshikimate 1-carboxyvinyltransferase
MRILPLVKRRKDGWETNMKIEFKGGRISGRVSPPPSKSHTHRAFFMASLAKGRSTVKQSLLSDDTYATLEACEAIGASVIHDVGDVFIDGGRLHFPKNPVDCRNSGTTMRLFTGICSLFSQPSTITGDETLIKRPMGPLLNALEQLDVHCESDNSFPPVTVRGPNKGGNVSVDGSKSSQYATSLIMAAPLVENDTLVTLTGNIVSRPYIDITVDIMEKFGASVKRDSDKYTVKGGTGYRPCDYTVPGDPSSAAFPLVAGALGGYVTVTGLDSEEKGDARLISILEDAGCEITRKDGEVTVKNKGRIKPLEIDMGDIPDLFPILAVLLSTAEGESRLYGAPHLRFKESDRIETTVEMLTAVGADILPTEDGCTIKGKERLLGGTVDAKDDHRILMAAGIASIVCENPVVFEGEECFSISYPAFLTDLERIGLRLEVTGE